MIPNPSTVPTKPYNHEPNTTSTRPPMTDVSDATTFLAGRTSGLNLLNYAVTILVPDTYTAPCDLPPVSAPITQRVPLPMPVDAVSSGPPQCHRYRVIGLLGSKSFPEIGYVFDPAVYGQGVATEAMNAFLPALWDAMPSPSEDLEGYDFAIARVDTENVASMRVLEKAGFVRGETTKAEFVSPQLGVRDSVAFWLARPGCEESLGEMMREDPKFRS